MYNFKLIIMTTSVLTSSSATSIIVSCIWAQFITKSEHSLTCSLSMCDVFKMLAHYGKLP